MYYLKSFGLFIFLIVGLVEGLERDYLDEDEMQNDSPHSSVVKTSHYRKHTQIKTKTSIFKGGCIDHPASPVNGNIQCSLDSGCRASCKADYKFPNGEKQLVVLCHDGKWHVTGTDWDFVPHCEPICLPQCQNNGICIAPHQCNCGENYSGPQCQYETKPCLNTPPPVLNSRRQCNSKSCTVSCARGFVYPDGSSIANLECRNGNWIAMRSDWVTIPDCQAVCSPPCQNGGICLPLNTCQCPQDYRGSQCQYSKDRCSPEILNFNGAYKCKGDAHAYSCVLDCSQPGIEFTFPPATEYICTYDNGYFEPQPIPQCKVTSSNYQIIPAGSSKNSYLKITNHSWTFEDTLFSQTSHVERQKFIKESHGIKTLYDVDQLSTDKSLNNIQNVVDIMKNNYTIVEDVHRPEAKTCFTWGGVHYKTFDGDIYTYDSDCTMTLIQETQDGAFTITIQNSNGCKNRNDTSCYRILNIYIQGKEYILKLDDNNLPILQTNKKKILPIPAQLTGLRVEMSGNLIVVSLDTVGINLKWDGGLFVQIKSSESLWNRTAGLCGRMNGDPADDKTRKDNSHSINLATFIADWKIDKTCDDNLQNNHKFKSDITEESIKFCDNLFADSRFQGCSKTLDLAALQSTCQLDYCNCHEVDKRKCACETMNIYVRQCYHDGLTKTLSWRHQNLCPMNCTGGRIYNSCGPKYQQSCGEDLTQAKRIIDTEDCEEGCFCPEGTIFHENKCIAPGECPCRLRGKSFPPSTIIPKNCNTCTCVAGQWICTQVICSSRCSVVGDPHYVTFDGKRYDFMGKCSYYLVKGDNYSIEAENVACLGAISESMGLIPSDSPSCVKSIKICQKNLTIKLKQNHQVEINNEEITKFPIVNSNTKIRIASSIFIVVHMPNNLEIWWDGISRVYINAPATFYGNTKGLCGTFTNNQKDDFLTPSDDVEQSILPFTNKWKTNEQCEDILKEDTTHPCDKNPERLSTAEKYCSIIWSNVFSSCHWHVDPEEFYKNCKYDMCSCEGNIERCLCPILSSYAKECAGVGVKIIWRTEVSECQVHCPAGQEYQICGNSCTRSCNDISFNHVNNIHKICNRECVEGCNCPEGQTLDNHGECIDIDLCPCYNEGMEFKPGYREIRAGIKRQNICICKNAIWSCQEATDEEIKKYPSSDSLKTICSTKKNLELTNCEPAIPKTCRNMNDKIIHSPAICMPGCICKKGYVLDSPRGNCVKQESCPCYHGGKSYTDGSTMQEECNTCKCDKGHWKCTDKICPGICSVWGDSHYKTFDDKTYDFQGACDYVLVKGSFGADDCFEISTQNVPCGTSWVTCSKAITLSIGTAKNREKITLTNDKQLSLNNYQRIAVRYAGEFLFLDVPDLGLVVQWDKGTRVYIKLDPKWKSKTKGLCGDYNDNSQDDFKTPSGGISEVSARIFGDSWKKNNNCPEPKDITDTCTQHPERKIWAVEKCGKLKTSLFEACHSEVDIEPYIERCIFDTCGCDQGGDCECLCTALAAYAHECNNRGVPIKWRSKNLCPMQCDEKCSNYSPCISTCPRETCDYLLNPQIKKNSQLCTEDTCIEGCLPKECPNDEVYLNSTYQECVPRSTCKPICLEKEGIIYYEGDKVSSDLCQTCFCSRGKIICNGLPCTSSSTTTTTTTTTRPAVVYMEESEKCIDGWTPWINKHSIKKSNNETKTTTGAMDIEPLPSMIDLLEFNNSSRCSKDKMIDIKCQSIDGHLSPKETGLDVECSLERGLICQSNGNELPCVDFEISVLCKCENTPASDNCDITRPNQADPIDCHVFYECVPGINGATKLIKKTCGQDMFYNPVAMICDWWYNVITLRPLCKSTLSPATTTTTTTTEAPSTNKCKENEIWNDCAIKCSRTCQYYNYQLKKQNICIDGTGDCVPGCIAKDKKTCGKNKYWRDPGTCVDIGDCNCISHNEKSVKPGVVVEETNCKRCQCLSNFYTCDNTFCEKSTTVKSTTPIAIDTTTPISVTTNIIIVPSTLSPAAPCINKHYNSLVEYFKGTSEVIEYNSSSSEDDQPWNHDPKLWQAKYINTNQWYEIKLPKLEPIYGIIISGNPADNKFVTSYKLLYSQDGHEFSYMPDILSGPIDAFTPAKHIFTSPIEAKIIKINPQTWHDGISMSVDLIGCDDSSVTVTPKIIIDKEEETIKPICDEPMGFDNGVMVDEQVTVSSTTDSSSLSSIKLSSPGIWQPKLDNPHQYVQFNFFESRNITGIETKGANNIWTIAYKIYYGNDGINWNPIIDHLNIEKIFTANFDDKTTKINYFTKPIQAQYLKIQPIKWHQHVGLKVEVHGCFISYPAITNKPIKIQVIQSACNVCHEIFLGYDNVCKCNESLWWNGVACVEKHNCPCVHEGVPYVVGATFESSDCQKCICTMTGTVDCQIKPCEPCDEPNMRSVVTELCGCACKPCSTGTRLCPTSNICINDSLWCNGVKDCPDDETNCRKTIENPSVITNNHSTIIEVTTVEIKNVTTLQCERPVCPPGYKLIPVNQNSRKSSKSSVKNSSVKGGTKGRSRGRPKETRKISHESTIFNDDNNLLNDAINLQITCQQFSCVPTKPPPIRQDNKKPIECPKVECPQNYKIIYETQSMFKLEACPKYVCKPPPPIEVICNITGRTFNTFDNLEYKYDICNHILARNMLNNEWYVNLEKHCDNLNQNCKQLLVITIDDDVVIFHSDMHVEINEFSFSPRQVKRLGDKSGSFRISRIGNIIHFVCSKYGFWIIWDENTNVKIGVTTNLKNYVDGLCGFFDGNPDNDRQMPNGKQAKTSEDFGNSWIMDGSAECQAPKILCSREIYDHAKEICNEMMDRSFSICRNHLDFDKYLSRCLETSCMCINGNQTINDCRCRALTSFTTDCQASDINIDLSTWRNIHNCPVNCPAPFVHKDCFRNKCEMSCDNLQEIEPCPLMEGVCFCGCFCPDGTIRNGENCIPASECRDCTCQGFGNGNFINFDKNNFTFTGNCTYVLSQDVSTINDNKNTYQILITNIPCERGICTEAISISYKDHYLEIQQNINDKKNKKISVTMDGEGIDQFPFNNNWTNIIEENEKNLKILIPVIQLELTSFVHNFGFTLKLPSHIFGGAMEGLCGNCNANDQDDIKKKNGELTDNIQDFGMSWLVSGLPQARILSDGDCGVQNAKEICLPPHSGNDPCKKLLDGKLFGQCHSIVDPAAYLSSCYDTLCKKGDICGDIEAYARSCRQTGLCSNWRSIDFCPYNCPADLEYQSCGSSCPKTCDTINDPQSNKCAEEFNQEGCFCPKNYVTHNGTCVLEKNCLICDNDGHIDGDTWQPDKCTTCTCNKKIINCQVTSCPTIATICEINSTPVLVEPSKSNEECCPKYICIPKPAISTTTTVCLDTQQPDCGWGQMMKTTIGTDGCQKFICECLPPEECPTVNLEASNVPGFVEIVNSSSCCPKAERICKIEMCPPAPSSCPEYYTLETSQSPEGCCMNYKCQLPNDICLYLMTTDNATIVGKKIGEKWQDGPCLSCICEIDYNNETKSNCLSTKCPGIEDNQHKNDYVLIEKQITGECCPLIEAVACKGDNGIVHNIGNEWYPDKNNSCLINKCEIEPDGIVKKKTVTQQCSINCERGYEYKQPEEPSKKCCGDCIPVSCVVNDTIKNIGDTWKSADYCTDYRCLIENGTLRVIESTTTCEKLDQFEIDNYEIHTESLSNECCPKYKRTGCKSNGKIYNSGATWKDEFDNCLTNMCVDVKDKNKIELTHVRQDCNVTCEFGWEYESSNSSQECCGRCKQVYCLDKGILHKPETTWSTPDNCTSYECKYSENKEQLIIQTILTVCQDVSTCPVEFIYQDGCCQKCNMTNIFDLHQACAAEVLEIQSTIGILKDKNQHGICKNIEGIDGMTECRGNCQSSTHFDPASWIQQTDCSCCQPIDMKNIDVDLVCDDGVKFTKKIYVPTACSCETCSGSLKKNIMPIRKVGVIG